MDTMQCVTPYTSDLTGPFWSTLILGIILNEMPAYIYMSRNLYSTTRSEASIGERVTMTLAVFVSLLITSMECGPSMVVAL